MKTDFLFKDDPMTDPHEYKTMCRPVEIKRAEKRARAGRDDIDYGSDEDEGDDIERHGTKVEGCLCLRPVADNPKWHWVIMQAAWRKKIDNKIALQFRDPDSFGMYTFNDHAGYGIQELIENMLVEFDEASTSKDKWIEIVCLVHLIQHEEIGGWRNLEDGEQVNETFNLIGTALLSNLALFESEGQLRPDSEILDLAVVLLEYLDMAEDLEAYGIEHDGWHENVIAYARKYDIDLAFAPHHANEWEGRKELGDPDSLPAASSKKGDPWDWKKKFKQFEKDHSEPSPGVKKDTSTLGGFEYDITKWTRARRAKHSFDKKDPIPEEIVKAIEGGEQVMLGPM